MAQSKEFAVGTIVKLKSGGPDMTIKEVVVNYTTKRATGDLICQWFAGKGLQQGGFPIDSVELVKPDTKSD